MADKFLDKTGLAYFWEKIKAYFQSQHITPPEYTIVRLANEEVGYAASYVLKKDGTQVGATINIPKDYLVRSGEVKTVTVADEPYDGAVVGDKYLDFVVNTIDDSGNISHIYIPVSDLVDTYVAGNGIHISDNNYISVKVSQQGVDHGLGVGGDGLTVRMVTPSVNGVGGTHGAMYAADKEKLDNLEIIGVFTTGSDTEPPVEGNDGLVPAPTWAERLNFLRGDATWANPAENSKELQNAVLDPSASGTSIEFISNISQNENGEIRPFKKTVRTMVASGQNHASGLVPDPGSTAGNKRYLCENGTWAEPNGGGSSSTPTDVQINGTSITDNNIANIQTEGVYNASTNKIATMSDVENAVPSIPNYKIEELAAPTNGFRSSYRLEKDGSAISDSDTIDIPNEFTPIVSKEYTGTDFYAPSGTWDNSSRYFMSVRPDALKEYWYVKYRVRVWIPSDTTEKRFTDSIIEYFGSGISMKGYRIWNTINTSYASYYQVAYWLTDDGYNNQNPTDLFGHVLGTSILYGTNYTTSSWYRHVRVDLLAYEGCEVNMFDNLVKWSEYKTSTGATNVATGVEHPDYSTTGPSTYNATSQGLQETGDATDTSNMYLPYARFTAGAYGMMNRSLIMQDGQGKWQSFTTSSGNSTTKTKNPSGFRLGSNIYYLSSTTNYAADAILGTSLVRAFVALIDFRYSLNVTTTAGGANNLLPYKPVYIVGTLGNDGLFYLDDVWWTQDEPSTENGKIYIKVSPAVYNDYSNDRCYRGDLFSYGYSYWYKNGRFQRYYDVDWKANDEDVVHKAGAETITGEKTFNSGVKFGVGSQLKFETTQEEGTYIEAGDDNGVKTLMFAGLEDDSSVRLENIATPVLGTDAANKAYVDSKGDNNLVKLNGRSGQYGVTPRSLCAFAVSTSAILEIIEPFTTTGGINGKPVRQGVTFPIGCKIYYHPDYNAIPANTDFTSKEFYATYDDVDARYTAVTGQNISLYSSSQSGVYLRVNVDNGYWSPYYKPNDTTEIIVTPHDFQTGNFYIYLGKTVGSTGYKFQLEDNNPLYYYDGTKLVDWATYQSSEAAPSYTAGDGIDITNNVISCMPRPYKKETFTPASFNASSAYSKGWQNFVASSNLEVGTYKVTLQVHLYIVSNADNMMPAGCVVNAYMRSKATASSSYQYILGATETFSGGVLPETSIPTGRGIISKVLNVVGFMEITGDEDSGCSLEVGFTTNSSLNVMIGNTTPLDGSYAGLCSGNDFVLLEKIA